MHFCICVGREDVGKREAPYRVDIGDVEDLGDYDQSKAHQQQQPQQKKPMQEDQGQNKSQRCVGGRDMERGGRGGRQSERGGISTCLSGLYDLRSDCTHVCRTHGRGNGWITEGHLV